MKIGHEPQESRACDGKPRAFRMPPFVLGCSLLLALLGPRSIVGAVLVRATGGDGRGQSLHELTDPCLGLQWRLVIDPSHPGWPAQMILLDSKAGETNAPQGEKNVASGNQPARVIRAGDRVTVDQDSGVMRARLQAVALESAAVGQPVKVRLIINSDRPFGFNSAVASNGPVISVIATGNRMTAWGRAGQTAAAPENEGNKR